MRRAGPGVRSGSRPLLASGLRTGAGVAALALGLGALLSQSAAPLDSTVTLQALASVSLTDDDGDAALFDGSEPLVPGRSQVRCLEVRSGADATGDVVVYADQVTGALAPQLQVVV